MIFIIFSTDFSSLLYILWLHYFLILFWYDWLKGPHEVKIHLAGNLDPIRHTYKVEDLQADAKDQHLVKSVHLQAECEDRIAEAKWLQSLADKQGKVPLDSFLWSHNFNIIGFLMY